MAKGISDKDLMRAFSHGEKKKGGGLGVLLGLLFLAGGVLSILDLLGKLSFELVPERFFSWLLAVGTTLGGLLLMFRGGRSRP